MGDMGREVSETASALIATLHELAVELHRTPPSSTLTLDSSLDRDFGFDSLGRVELVLRLERRFGVRISEQVMAGAETPRDLLRVVLSPESPLEADSAAETVRVRIGAADGVPTEAETLVAALRRHVERHPERLHIVLLDERGCRDRITYGALWEQATAVATGLRARGIAPGDGVALMLPTSQEYFVGFMGILLAGGIPVPLYPPLRMAQIEDHVRRQTAILRNAGTVLMITVPEAQRLVQLLKTHVEALRGLVTIAELSSDPGNGSFPDMGAHDIALLQYTSGSTGTPKGVVLTHGNLLANIRAMGSALAVTSDDVLVSWLPLYHDMGLIGAWLGSLYHAVPFVVMSPLTFLARPERWLRAIGEYGGTISAGPNFAFELCVRKIDESSLAGVDLSSWRLAVNGAEPISPETLTRFIARFAPVGFRPTTMAPVYGLAEASVGLTFPPLGREPVIDRVGRAAFATEGVAVPATDGDPAALRFVACGRPLPGHQIRIVDESGREASDREVGRIQFQGPSATSGYYHNPEATKTLFDGPWLETGDFGYQAEGDLYVTGRAKEVIIRAGRNLYPYELEDAVGGVPGIRRGCVAVFGTTNPSTGTEQLVIVAETRETDPDKQASLRNRIHELSMDLLNTAPDDIVLAPSHAVLKTSSGKIRRSACRERYERGLIGRSSGPVWAQVVRLALGGSKTTARRWVRAAGRSVYAGYAWIVFVVGAGIALGALLVMPSLRLRWGIVRAVARAGFMAAGIPLRVHGDIPGGACVIASNHASYVDAVVLTTVLPNGGCFVAKRELGASAPVRFFLRRLGSVFVERFDPQRSADEAARLADVVRGGGTLVVFPEGTFGRAPGLRPFRMGGFLAAARTGVPVVPVALRGTRSVLRDTSWFPRRGPIDVVIGEAVMPTGTDWAAALSLRDRTRDDILRWCGEPDLRQAGVGNTESTPS